MDPVTTAALVSALGTGLVEVFKIVFTKGLEKGIVEPAVEPLRDWVARGYDEKKDAAALHAALLGALDDLDKEQGLGAADRLEGAGRRPGREPGPGRRGAGDGRL